MKVISLNQKLNISQKKPKELINITNFKHKNSMQLLSEAFKALQNAR